jgi:hypothetical protein
MKIGMCECDTRPLAACRTWFRCAHFNFITRVRIYTPPPERNSSPCVAHVRRTAEHHGTFLRGRDGLYFLKCIVTRFQHKLYVLHPCEILRNRCFLPIFLGSVIITITSRDTGPTLLEEARRIKSRTCFEATKSARLQEFTFEVCDSMHQITQRRKGMPATLSLSVVTVPS